MANPKDRYPNAPSAGGLHYSASFSHRPYPDAPQYGNGEYYNSHFGGDMDAAGTQALQRSQSTAHPPGSYFASPPGNNDDSVYSSQQQSPDLGYSASFRQQPQQNLNYDSAPYPTTPVYSSGGQPPQRPAYNPAAYTGPQRHASTATGGYSTPSPQYSPNPGSSYNPGAFNTAPYPTSYVPKPAAQSYQQPYYGGATNTGYNQYPGRNQYTAQPQQNYSYQQQVPPYPTQSTAQTTYRPQPPPPPQSHPPTSPTTYGPSGTYGGQTYNNLPYPSQDTPPLNSYPSQTLRPPTHYSSDSEGNNLGVSPPGYGNEYDYGTHSMPSPAPPPPPAHGYFPERTHSTSRPLPERPYPTFDDDPVPTRRESVSQGRTMYHEDTDDGEDTAPDPLFSRPPQYKPENGVANGYLDPSIGAHGSLNTGYASTSDAEAAQGLEAMRLAEADEAERVLRESTATLTNTSANTKATAKIEEEGSEEEDWGVDLTAYGGGFPGDTIGYYGSSNHTRDNTYADEQTQTLARNASTSTYSTNVDSLGRTTSVMTTSTMATTITQESDDTRAPPPPNTQQGWQQNWDIPDEYQLHPFRDGFSSAATLDASGTGGLAEPKMGGERRLSFDEGEEEVARTSNSQSADEDSYPVYPELFYHPPETTGVSSRPLPSVPQEEVLNVLPRDCQGRPLAPKNQSASNMTLPAPQFPRSTSLSSHGSSPVTVAPARSKTDAANAKQSNRMSVRVPLDIAGYDASTGTPQESLISHLPAIPLAKKKFDPTKISTREFKKCNAPWALSAISAWIRELADGEAYLRERTVEEGVVALFTHYVPTMNIADAESLAARVVRSMIAEGALVRDEEWVKFGDGELCGVIYQICGSGCYAPKLHEQECSGRCYSHHCSRTLKQIALLPHPNEPQPKAEDWATFWKITKENIADVSKKEIERQNNLHEIVHTETEYMEDLWVLTSVYRDSILQSNPSIIHPSKLQDFVHQVFGKADVVRKVSEAHLLPQLKFRQREQGPWVVGFSDIFREWIRKARQVYIDYAANFPNADWLVRREADRNLVFRGFLDQCRQDPRTRRLDWVTFLKAPITRLQRYSLLLSTVLKHTVQDSEEKQNLAAAIEEIKAVTLECDARVDEQTKIVTLKELGTKLQFRQGTEVNLRLDDKGREVIFRGDLQRHTSRFNFIETHAILFDHYLILAKTVQQKDIPGGTKHEKYDVSRMPIPMGLLVLESTNDEPVVRSSVNKLGLGGPTTVKQTPAPGARPGQLAHNNTSLSTGSVGSAAGRMIANSPSDVNSDKIMYPFRIKHLGKSVKSDENTYTLYAPSAQNRQDWCDKIILAQERHASSLHAQKAEPFRLRVMADTAFGYDTVSNLPKPIAIRGTPLDRAIKEVEEANHNQPRPSVVCKAMVNCATSFKGQFGNGGEMLAIGTDYGVYITEANNPRGWRSAITVAKVTQIAVLEDFSLFLVLADKALIAYHLDVVIPNDRTETTTKQRHPQKLSGAIGFFTTGRMNDRTLVFYKKREGLSAIFKVLEPVFQKATEKKSRFGRKGTTEFFRDYDDFYIPTDCYGLNLFQSSFAIQTSKGFEVMRLDTKRSTSIPELKASHVSAIASRLSGQRPLGMFRLSDIEFLLCYEDCAVYCNKHGDVSRSVIMEFVGKAKTAAIYGPYILLFDNDFVEIRNAENGRLRQVIAGRDCRCLDDARSGSQSGRTVKLGMAHPEVDGRQLVVELIFEAGRND